MYDVSEYKLIFLAAVESAAQNGRHFHHPPYYSGTRPLDDHQKPVHYSAILEAN